MEKLLSIKQAAAMLGVSLDTLRRWDENGELKSVRVKKGKYEYRFYDKERLNEYLAGQDIFGLAYNWIRSETADLPRRFYYCSDTSVFNGRLSKLESDLMKKPEFAGTFSLIVMIAGEIGNNSFDHNLGNWPDVAGIFFAYNIGKRTIVLADRGQGILKTLKRAKPELATHEDAIKTAFTEFITGRAPEHRGNGLKLVRKVVIERNFKLSFHTGDALLFLRGGNRELQIKKTADQIRGCMAVIYF